jgi:two-component system response regulator YesN
MDRKKIKEVLADKNMLFVDDDESICEGIEALLSRYFNSVKIALNADDAIDIYKSNDIDIIVSDVTMPDKTGFELASELYDYDENLKIVFISGHSEEVYVDKMQKYGSNYLIKPINYQLLFDTLINVLED